MLEWKSWSDHPHDTKWYFSCGEELVAVVDYSDSEAAPNSYDWTLVVAPLERGSTQDGLEAAKAAAESAFRAWLDRAGLVPKPPCSSDIIKDLSLAETQLDRMMKNAEFVQDGYVRIVDPKFLLETLSQARTMLAAAPKPGEAP